MYHKLSDIAAHHFLDEQKLREVAAEPPYRSRVVGEGENASLQTMDVDPMLDAYFEAGGQRLVPVMRM